MLYSLLCSVGPALYWYSIIGFWVSLWVREMFPTQEVMCLWVSLWVREVFPTQVVLCFRVSLWVHEVFPTQVICALWDVNCFRHRWRDGALRPVYPSLSSSWIFSQFHIVIE